MSKIFIPLPARVDQKNRLRLNALKGRVVLTINMAINCHKSGIFAPDLIVKTMNNYSLTVSSAPDNGASLKVDLLSVKKAALVLRAINHKLRQQMLKQIDENGKMTVTELYVKLRLEQSVASQHLAILRKAGFVKTTRDGKFIYYSVNVSRIQELSQFVEELLN